MPEGEGPSVAVQQPRVLGGLQVGQLRAQHPGGRQDRFEFGAARRGGDEQQGPGRQREPVHPAVESDLQALRQRQRIEPRAGRLGRQHLRKFQQRKRIARRLGEQAVAHRRVQRGAETVHQCRRRILREAGDP
ncbi:hypothetical protein [Nocardia brasiliensis]|uniref:hypothetical protein n=1 Tax=Nocardia brasiliensis TaxID=37326 RepID=UPI0024538EA5|nr:hypothetical protein [Nocardia brasiliensis]